MLEQGRQLRKVETESSKEWGFSELQQRVRNIYQEHDIECGYGPDTMLAKLLGNSVTLKQVIRKTPQDFDSINRSITNVFIWAATVANASGVNMQEVMEKQFGHGCPHCGQMPCLLTQGGKCEKPTTENKSEKKDFQPPSSLNEWQKHFRTLYSNNFDLNNIQSSLRNASIRLTEETGELVASAYEDIEREIKLVSFQTDILPFEAEMADLLAWAMAVANSLDIELDGFSLEKSLKEKYESGCPYCKSPKCICPKAKTFMEELKK